MSFVTYRYGDARGLYRLFSLTGSRSGKVCTDFSRRSAFALSSIGAEGPKKSVQTFPRGRVSPRVRPRLQTASCTRTAPSKHTPPSRMHVLEISQDRVPRPQDAPAPQIGAVLPLPVAGRILAPAFPAAERADNGLARLPRHQVANRVLEPFVSPAVKPPLVG